MDSKRRVWVAIAVLLPVLAAGAFGVHYLLNRDTTAQGNDAAKSNSASVIPDLGSRGQPMREAANDAAPAANDEAAPENPSDGEEPQPEPEAANSAREIDIWLSNLAVATRASDRRGIALSHEMLANARPHELVDERVRAALDSEQNALVRIQYSLAFHAAERRLDWAVHVHDTRTGKLLGTDDQFAGGEIEELKLIAETLFQSLVENWRRDESGDARLMALLRNLLDTERPDWLLELAVRHVFTPMIEAHMVSFARALEQELRNALLRRKAELGLREWQFFAFVLTFDPHTQVLAELERSEWWDYASALALLYDRRGQPGHVRAVAPMVEWVNEFSSSDEIPKLFARLLQGPMPAEHKRLLIQRIAAYDVPDGRAMIEAGLARKDDNYPDYLTAFGSFASTDADLQRLTAAADDPDVAAARGAIEGLRQSSLAAADAELRKVLEQGTNLGVKSQALGALLSRAEDKSALLEEYLDPNKDAALRAVAAAAVPLSDVARLQRVAEEDLSPTVRLAALNRVGSIQPASERERKDLHGWFVKMKDRDNSPVIRSAARKYAEATAD
ncbi:MAG: hypothetical protein H6841_11475 [Planctomycetes bacterium]|nr:hypothetical protein [Planctomycetota bacterium]MCB9935365.1 hypothetical protein [Planctomycetota bacterium]